VIGLWWALWACGGGSTPVDPTGGHDSGVPLTSTAETSGPTSVTGDTAVVPVGPGTLVDDGEGIRSPAVVSALGVVWVAWVADDDDGYGRVWLSRSDDDGATFSPPTVVSDGGTDVQARWPDGPSLVVGSDRLLVSYISTVGASYEAQVLAVDHDLEPASVVGLTRVGIPPTYHSVSYPTLALDEAGQGLLALIASPFTDGELWLVRESEGWATEDVSAASPLEVPCECCPPALLVRGDEVVVAWRGDIAKEIYVGFGGVDRPVDTFEVATATGVEGPLCPLDGPQLLDADGTLHMAWSDANTGGARAYWSTRSETGWQHDAVAPLDGTDQWRVFAGFGADGAVVGWETGLQQSYRSAEIGASVGSPVAGPAGPLRQVRATTHGDRVVAVGLDEEGSLWFVPVD
jgi:hypothetical protein